MHPLIEIQRANAHIEDLARATQRRADAPITPRRSRGKALRVKDWIWAVLRRRPSAQPR